MRGTRLHLKFISAHQLSISFTPPRANLPFLSSPLQINTSATMSSLPPFMNLPRELHLVIADQLDFPDNMNLRMVHRYFYKLIKPLSYEEGLEAEVSRFALKNDLFVCNSCYRLRRKEKFVEANITYKPGLGKYEDRSLTLPVPYCIDCGYQQQLPRCRLGEAFFNNPGDRIMSQIFCNGCGEFPELSQRKRFSMCKTCWQKSSADWIQKLENTDFRDCHMSKHWHHSTGCETCFRPFTDCHWVQWYVSSPTKLSCLFVQREKHI